MAGDPTSKNIGDRSRPRRVLLVDDHDDARSLLAELLEMHGYDVHDAPDGATALALAARVLPDAAVIDIAMPEMDGYELAAALRHTAAGRPLRLIALSGFAQATRGPDGLFDAHLMKPTPIRRILSLLEADPGLAT